MTSLNTATLQVNFTEEATGSNIILEQLTKFFSFSSGALYARCFPAADVKFMVPVGKLKIGNNFPQQIYNESIKFSNSSSVALKYPDAFNVAVRPDALALEEITDINGDKIIQLTDDYQMAFDQETNSIVVTDKNNEPKNIYGACSISYTVLYTHLAYYPDISPIFGSNGGVTINLGSIYAYNNKYVQVLDMELDSDSEDWVEFARVTSKIVLDARGVWEFPTNWQGTYDSNMKKDKDQRDSYSNPGEFDGFSYEIDPDACFIDTRVHKIFWINSFGYLKEKDFNNGGDGYWAWYTPHFGDDTYDPVYELVYSSPPGGEKASSAEEFEYDSNWTTWRDIFLRVDKKALLEELQKEFPGIKEGNKNQG